MLRLEKVSKLYHSNDNLAVGIKNVTLEFNIGEFVAIVGESGSGKSTLLNILSGLDVYEEGEMYFHNERTSHYTQGELEKYRNDNIAFIFQKYNLIKSISVYKNVELALILSGYQGNVDKRVRELIDKVGLSDRITNKASQLSGGERQRVVIARALAKDADIIVADEPTGNLDSNTSREIINLLREVSKEKLVLIVTHDYDEVKDYITRRIVMHDGIVQTDASVRDYNLLEEVNKVTESREVTFKNLLKISKNNMLGTIKKSSFLTMFFIVYLLILSSFLIQFTSIQYEYFGDNNSTSDNIFYISSSDGAFLYNDFQKFEQYQDENNTLLYFGLDTATGFRLSSDTSHYYESTLEYAQVNEINVSNLLSRGGYKIVGALPQDSDEIIIPISIDDVVDYNLLNQTLTYYTYFYNASGSGYISYSKELKVVGYYAYDSLGLEESHEVYFHEGFIDVYHQDILSENILYGRPLSVNGSYFIEGINAFEIDDSLEDNEILLSNDNALEICDFFYNDLEDLNAEESLCKEYLLNSTITLRDTSISYNLYDAQYNYLDLYFSLNSDFPLESGTESYIKVNSNTFKQLTTPSSSNIAFYSANETARNELISILEAEGYTISYFQYDNTISNFFVAFGLLVALIIQFGVLSFTVIVFIKFCAKLFNSKKEEYNLLRSNGARKHVLKRIMLVETTVMLIIAYIAAFFLLRFALFSYGDMFFIMFRFSSFFVKLMLTLLVIIPNYYVIHTFVQEFYTKTITESLTGGEKL